MFLARGSPLLSRKAASSVRPIASSSALNRLQQITRNLTATSVNMSSSTEKKDEGVKGGITNWASTDGQFRRKPSVFRSFVSKAPGAEFPAEKGRYHLYVSLACPWAHRTVIVRQLKGLEDAIGLSIVHPFMGEKGWSWVPHGDAYKGQGLPKGKTEPDNIIPDTLYGVKYLRELYYKAQSDYEGRFTVPVLWDKKKETIVNNESSEIIRMMNEEFDDVIDPKYKGITFYPKEHQKEIDELNSWVYDTVNNGVYRSGFATTQEAYEENVTKLFDSLDRLEDILKGGKEYLIGDKLTEADIRLYTTIVRFDPVYLFHFKCNLKGSIRHSYPELNRWLRNLYWTNPAFKDTTDFDHIKIHYFTSHPQINPTRIVPKGPEPPIES